MGDSCLLAAKEVEVPNWYLHGSQVTADEYHRVLIQHEAQECGDSEAECAHIDYCEA